MSVSSLSNSDKANAIQSAPSDKKNKKVKVKEFKDWKLTEMIDVCHNLGWIDYGVKKLSHALRDFRNFIHPDKQISEDFYPNKDTCKNSQNIVQSMVNNFLKNLK